MIREIYPENISYKKRSVKIDGKWVPAHAKFDLNIIRVGKPIKLEFVQDLEGNYYILGGHNVNKID